MGFSASRQAELLFCGKGKFLRVNLAGQNAIRDVGRSVVGCRSLAKANGKLTALILTLLAGTAVIMEPSTQAAGTDDWPMLGHDAAHTGHSDSPVPGVYGAVKWSFKVTPYERLTFNPAAQDGYIYILYEDSPRYNGTLCCLNASNGELVWNQTLPIPTQYREDFAGISLTVANELIYTNSAAYNASNGQLVFNYEPQTMTGFPTVYNGTIYIIKEGAFLLLMHILAPKFGALQHSKSASVLQSQMASYTANLTKAIFMR